MVGLGIVRAFQNQGETNIVTRTHAELDLTNQADVQQFFAQENPAHVYLAAAKVDGMHSNNTHPTDFIYQNLIAQVNVVDAGFRNGVQNAITRLELHLQLDGRETPERRCHVDSCQRTY